MEAMDFIDQILNDLKPYEDKVVLSPLSEQEIESIQSKFKKRLPDYYKYFLKKIGLKQDFIWGLQDSINRFQDLNEFLSSEDYFRIGDNGGEDYWLIKFENEIDRTIYEYDYYCNGEIKSIGKTFDQLLAEALEDIKTRYPKLTPNSQKEWCVQFSINTGSPDFLIAQLKNKIDIPIKQISKIEYTDTTKAGVKSYKGLISINGQEVPISKQVILGAGSTNLYFNWKESIKDMQEHSFIKKLDKALDDCVFQHTLIDYGILDKS